MNDYKENRRLKGKRIGSVFEFKRSLKWNANDVVNDHNCFTMKRVRLEKDESINWKFFNENYKGRKGKRKNYNREGDGLEVGVQYSINKKKRWEFVESLKKDKNKILVLDDNFKHMAKDSSSVPKRKKKKGRKRRKSIWELRNNYTFYDRKKTKMERKSRDYSKNFVRKSNSKKDTKYFPTPEYQKNPSMWSKRMRRKNERKAGHKEGRVKRHHDLVEKNEEAYFVEVRRPKLYRKCGPNRKSDNYWHEDYRNKKKRRNYARKDVRDQLDGKI